MLTSSTPITTLHIYKPPELSDKTFQSLRSFIYEKTGIYFNDNKKYLLESRLSKRLQVLSLLNFDDYFRLLKNALPTNEELKFFYDAITIKETSFFRNPAQFDAFENSLITNILAQRQSNGKPKIRVWSSASASGEEAYSVAMIYLEKLKPKFPGLEIDIIATDISMSILETARKGVYRESSVRNMPKEYLDKYMRYEDARFHINDDVKKLVKFEYINLYDRDKMRAMRSFDVIFCCNVLIYFDTKSKVQVVSDLYNSLNRGGYLFIGYAEALHGISSAFKIVNFPKTVVYKKE